MKVNPMFFARLVERILKEQGLKQEEMAQIIREKCGGRFDRSGISNWSTGRQLPAVDKLLVLSELSGVPHEQLVWMKTAIELQRSGIELPDFNGATFSDGSALATDELHVIQMMREGDYFALAQHFLDKARKTA